MKNLEIQSTIGGGKGHKNEGSGSNEISNRTKKSVAREPIRYLKKLLYKDFKYSFHKIINHCITYFFYLITNK